MDSFVQKEEIVDHVLSFHFVLADQLSCQPLKACSHEHRNAHQMHIQSSLSRSHEYLKSDTH